MLKTLTLCPLGDDCFASWGLLMISICWKAAKKNTTKEWTCQSLTSLLCIADDRGRWVTSQQRAEASVRVPQRRLGVKGISQLVSNFTSILYLFIFTLGYQAKTCDLLQWHLKPNMAEFCWLWSFLCFLLFYLSGPVVREIFASLLTSLSGE